MLDSGERRALASEGHSFTLALVHVEGEESPRWIAVERLEPLDPLERMAWMVGVEWYLNGGPKPEEAMSWLADHDELDEVFALTSIEPLEA